MEINKVNKQSTFSKYEFGSLSAEYDDYRRRYSAKFIKKDDQSLDLEELIDSTTYSIEKANGKTQIPFVHVPKIILKSKLPSNSKLVYIELLSMDYKRKNEVFPSIETVSQELHLSRKTVEKALRNLEEVGLIDIKKQYKNNKRATNRYILNDLLEGDIDRNIVPINFNLSQKTEFNISKFIREILSNTKELSISSKYNDTSTEKAKRSLIYKFKSILIRAAEVNRFKVDVMEIVGKYHEDLKSMGLGEYVYSLNGLYVFILLARYYFSSTYENMDLSFNQFIFYKRNIGKFVCGVPNLEGILNEDINKLIHSDDEDIFADMLKTKDLNLDKFKMIPPTLSGWSDTLCRPAVPQLMSVAPMPDIDTPTTS